MAAWQWVFTNPGMRSLPRQGAVNLRRKLNALLDIKSGMLSEDSANLLKKKF